MKINRFIKKGTISRRIIDYLRFFHMAIGNYFVAYIPSYFIRRIFYKYFMFVKIGRHSHIQMGVRMYSPYKIKIGENCSIGNNTLLDGRRGIEIGNNVDLAGYVKILTLGHDLDDLEYKTIGGKVVVNDHASIFTGASILPGLIVEEGSVIALDAILTKDTEPWSIYAGNPAKYIRKRKVNTLTYLHNYKRYFH